MSERDSSQEQWIGITITRTLVVFSFLVVVGSFLLALFVSLYQSVTTPPKVWKAPLQTKKQNKLISQKAPTRSAKRRYIRACVQNLQALDQEYHRETTALWYRMRNGHRGYLTLWQEWTGNWRKRMQQLLKQCAMQPSPHRKTTHSTLSIQECLVQLQKRSERLKKKAKALWLEARHGHQSKLRRWKDWSRDWQRRMHTLIEKCPLYNKGEIAKAFHRASHKMLELQTKQEKVLHKFFNESAGLFRDIRQAIHRLKEELR